MRDSPLEEEEGAEDEEAVRQRMLLEASKIEVSPLADPRPLLLQARLRPKEGEKSMIAGQLLIYEIDEEPPIQQSVLRDSSASSPQTCAISRGNLMAVVGGLGGATGLLFFLTLALYLRLSRVQAGKLERAEPFSVSEDVRRRVSSAFAAPVESFVKSRRDFR